MKKYYRPTAKIFAILSAICIVLFAIGLILVRSDFEQTTLTILLPCFGGLLGVLFITIISFASFADVGFAIK